MSKRYKSIIFDDFSGGRGQKMYDIKESSKYYDDSNILPNKDGQPEPAPTFTYSAFANAIPHADSNFKIQHSDSLDGYVFFTTYLTGDYLKVYRASLGGSFSERVSVSAVENVYRGFSAFSRFYVHYFDGTDFLLKYMSSGGTSLTATTSTISEQINSHAYNGSILYLSFAQKIIQSIDGINFSTFVDFATLNLYPTKLFFIDNFLYGFLTNGRNRCIFVRFFSDGTYQEIRSFIVDDDYIDFAIIDNYRVCVSVFNIRLGLVDLYEYNSDTNICQKKLSINSHTYTNCRIHSFIHNQFLVNLEYASGADYIWETFLFNSDFSYFHLHNFSANYEVQHVIPDEQFPYFQTIGNGTGYARMYYINYNNFSGISFLYLPTIPLRGACPRQLIVRHSALSEATSHDVSAIDIYVKKDKATSWGSSILTSNTIGAVSKKYNFPIGDNLEYIQFAIGLTPNTDNEIPQDFELEFLYIPTGLNDSQ